MKYLNRIIIALCLTLLPGASALAQHSGLYAGAFLGGNALINAKSSDDQGNFTLSYTPSLMESAVVGWDLEPGGAAGEGRIELEYSHRSNPLDKVKFVEGKVNGGGAVTADSLLFNCIGVFRDERKWSPYLGAGIGAARIEAARLTVIGQSLSNDSTFVFAYQLQTGIDFALSDRVSLDLGYRFFSSSRPKFTEANSYKFAMDYLNHSAVLGLRVGF